MSIVVGDVARAQDDNDDWSNVATTLGAVGAHYGSINSAAVSSSRRNIRAGRYAVGSVVKRLEARIPKDS